MVSLKRIGIIGAGNYGTALAQCFSRKAEQVFLLSDSEIVASTIEEFRMNLKFLPGVLLNSNISCGCEFSKIWNCGVIFMAAPAMAFLSICKQIKESGIKAPIVLCSKGFDVENGRLQSDLFEEILDNDHAIFSGPSSAGDIARGLPAGVNIASKNGELSQKISESLSSETFKIRAIDDPAGLQIAGALKNVLAIGCGILLGLKLGDSAVAKLISDGLGEAIELAVALGGKKETFLELGGIGDVVLTCGGKRSRNVLFGEHLADGGSLDNWTGPLAEGAFAVKAIPIFERKLDLKLKIFSGIYQIIHEKNPAFEALRFLK